MNRLSQLGASLAAGESISLLGRNGVGKSSLLRAGLLLLVCLGTREEIGRLAGDLGQLFDGLVNDYLDGEIITEEAVPGGSFVGETRNDHLYIGDVQISAAYIGDVQISL